MLCLSQQVNRAHLCISGFVCNHQRFGWPCEQVDTDPSVKLSLGFGHIHIARTHQHVHRRNGGRTDGHGHHGLHPAKDQDLVRACHGHGGHDGRVGFSLIRRSRGHNALDTCHLGGQHTHVGGSQQRVFSARDIATDGVDRDVLVAQDDSRQSFNFHILHRVALNLGEISHLLLSKGDVFDFAR